MPDNDGLAVLRDEIRSYYAGFGQPASLRTALREAALLVPLTDDDRLFLLRSGGLRWLCAFTTIEEYARYTMARATMTEGGVAADRQYRYHTFWGARLLAYTERQEDPTGIAVDIAGRAPMAFPPNVME
ncbi:SseB family protein [Nocardia sp. NPDC024068]|uniref:SseB family protein n=1 Tax=Nocardia sp. NPDC024068 TaxID=3157197 RepID=UPI0033C933DF